MAWPIIAAAAQQAAGQTQSAVTSAFGANQENKAAAGARNYDWWKTLWQRFWQTNDFNKENEEYWKRWNADNAYNDPSNVARRLSAAGFNPAQSMSNAPLASASSSPPSMPSAIPMNAMPATDHSASINQLGSGLRQSLADTANLINAFSQANKTDAEAARIRGLTPHETEFARYHSQEQRHKAQQAGYESWLAGESLFDRRELVDLSKQSLGLQLDETKAQIDNLKAEKALRELQIQLNVNADERAYQSLRADLIRTAAIVRQINAEIARIRADTDLTYTERENRIQSRREIIEKIRGQQIENVLSRLRLSKGSYDSSHYDERNKLRDRSTIGRALDQVLFDIGDYAFGRFLK